MSLCRGSKPGIAEPNLKFGSCGQEYFFGKLRKNCSGMEVNMKHGKKMIAPIIVTIIMLLYYIGIAAAFLIIRGIPLQVKALMVVIPLLSGAVMVGVLASRIREIEGGEEDDLSKY
jgi:hypothetical protein